MGNVTGGNSSEPPLRDDATYESDVLTFFKENAQLMLGAGKLDDLLSGIAKGTRGGYITAWKHRFQFTLRTPGERWITKVGPRWDETLIDWVLFETRILGLQASTMRSKLSGLRYWHLLSGYPDWSKWSGRYKQVLKSVAGKDRIQRNYPFNLELMQRVKENVTSLTDWDKLDKSSVSPE